MTDDPTGRSIKAEIGNVTQGQVAVGEDITQSQTVVNTSAPPTAEELKELTAEFAKLKAQVERDAPPDVRDEAVRQTEALQQATIAEKPDVSVMASAKKWFLDHAPGLLGAVTSVVINPIVGKIVDSAGRGDRERVPEVVPGGPIAAGGSVTRDQRPRHFSSAAASSRSGVDWPSVNVAWMARRVSSRSARAGSSAIRASLTAARSCGLLAP